MDRPHHLHPVGKACRSWAKGIYNLRETPPKLAESLTSDGRRARMFFNRSRVYNNLFAFCSFGGNVDDSINTVRGPYVFRVSGQTYHNFGSLIPPEGRTPKFAQLYISFLSPPTHRAARYSTDK